LPEPVFTLFARQDCFRRAHSKYNLGQAMQRPRVERETRAGKFQSVTAKCNLPCGKHRNFRSTIIFPACATRQASSHKMQKVSAASIDDCVSCAFTPSTAKPDCPRRKSQRA
jgi:hypothetical protein